MSRARSLSIVTLLFVAGCEGATGPSGGSRQLDAQPASRCRQPDLQPVGGSTPLFAKACPPLP
jgi:hypothetical protein